MEIRDFRIATSDHTGVRVGVNFHCQQSGYPLVEGVGSTINLFLTHTGNEALAPDTDDYSEDVQIKLLREMIKFLGNLFGGESIRVHVETTEDDNYLLQAEARYIYQTSFSILLAFYIVQQVLRTGDVDSRSRALLQMGRLYFQHPDEIEQESVREQVLKELADRFSNDTINAFVSMLYPNLKTVGNLLRKVLLVDDDNEVTEIYSDVLASRGFSIHTACDGLEALDRMKQHEYDLVISDVEMPKMNGYELFDELRKKAPQLPVMIITGYQSDNHMEQFLEQGAAAFLYKPFSLARFVTEVEGIFHRIS